MYRKSIVLCIVSLAAAATIPAAIADDGLDRNAFPRVADVFGAAPSFFENYDVILKPDKLAEEWWAGAPSVVRDKDGVFWLACRMRTADAPRGLRGYEIRILRSDDGIQFETVKRIPREEVPIPGFERPALLIDPDSGQFKLYGCGPWRGGPWSIIKFDDADTPAEFDPATVRPVITPLEKAYERDIIPLEYKDPFVIHAGGMFQAYVIGVMRRTERIYHFKSRDGETWTPAGDPYESIMDLEGWHDFYVRPASVVPMGIGYLFVYEGSGVNWYDPVYNIATGLGFTFDLHRVIDLTPESPLAVSPTPGDHFHTFRYSHWLRVGDELWVYAENATPEGYNEIRRYIIPLQR